MVGLMNLQNMRRKGRATAESHMASAAPPINRKGAVARRRPSTTHSLLSTGAYHTHGNARPAMTGEPQLATDLPITSAPSWTRASARPTWDRFHGPRSCSLRQSGRSWSSHHIASSAHRASPQPTYVGRSGPCGPCCPPGNTTTWRDSTTTWVLAGPPRRQYVRRRRPRLLVKPFNE